LSRSGRTFANASRESSVSLPAVGGSKIGPLGEGRAVLLDVSFERMRGARCTPERGASVHAADDERQLVDDRVRDALPIRHVVESGVLIESPHVDGPFDDFTVATKREGLPLSDNRERRQVDVGR
jgi:hypothetical protein